MNDPRLCGLDRMAVILSVAESFYLGRMLLSGNEAPPPWDELPAGVRHDYVTLAQATLERAPVLPVTVFDQAVELARAAGERVLAFRKVDV